MSTSSLNDTLNGKLQTDGKLNGFNKNNINGNCNKVNNDNNNDNGGIIKLPNPYLELLDADHLYHLGLNTDTHDLVKLFGDVKFVCMGGTQKRMYNFAKYIMKEIDYELPYGSTLFDISLIANRYSMYKIGPVLSISHGMGISSVSILLHEIIKLMYYAKAKEPVFFRIGTSGGLGVEPGSVIVSNGAVDGMLRNVYEIPILGKRVCRPTILDERLAIELKELANPNNNYVTLNGKTMCASDFYEEQGRLDGAFCSYTRDEKLQYLQHLNANGVINIEMEVCPFAALTYQAGIKSAVVCVTLLNRLQGDQVSTAKDTLEEWQIRPQELVARYIKKHLNMHV